MSGEASALFRVVARSIRPSSHKAYSERHAASFDSWLRSVYIEDEPGSEVVSFLNELIGRLKSGEGVDITPQQGRVYVGFPWEDTVGRKHVTLRQEGGVWKLVSIGIGFASYY